MANDSRKKAARKAPAKSAAHPAVDKTTTGQGRPLKAAAKKTPAKKAASKKLARKSATPAAQTAAGHPPPAAPSAAARSTRKSPPLTTIVARIDVGFGNHLYLRGSGANLSWEKGVVMGNASANEWVWSSDSVEGEVECKVLINDEVWADGPNATVAAGERIVLEPDF